MLLRINNNAQWVRTWTGRYKVQSGKQIFNSSWKKKEFQVVQATQAEDPVWLLITGKRHLWYFHDNFYWEDDGLQAEDENLQLLCADCNRRKSDSL